MGTSKTEKFSEMQNELALIAKALGHPARIAILQYLTRVNQCICGDLVDEIPLAQATISQHLKALKIAGIIHGNVDGPSVCYCINEERWEFVQDALNSFFNAYPPDDNCC
ncbi:MAG: winged helix-turn-helix transcriptional regulator [Bacteroidetes bacterium]|nr:winged helix-turn-helix transcriptional regulator [Bacteroidota bacterium]